MNIMSVVHLCIDVQKKYPSESVADAVWWFFMKRKVRALTSELDKRDIPTIHVALSAYFQSEACLYRHMSLENKEVIQTDPKRDFDLPLSERDWVAFKNDYSAYKEEAIVGLVEMFNPSRLILSGVFEDDWSEGEPYEACCLTQTAIDFRKAGYQVTVAAEATNMDAWFWLSDSRPLSLEQRQAGHREFGVDVQPIKEILRQIDALRPSPMRRIGGSAVTLRC